RTGGPRVGAGASPWRSHPDRALAFHRHVGAWRLGALVQGGAGRGTDRAGRRLKLPAVLISSALAGALQAGAFSPWAAAWGAHAPWLLSAGALLLIVYTWSRLASLRQALLSGLGFGTLWLVGGTGWMFVSLHRYGGLPAWLAALAVLLLCLALAVFMALVAAAWWRWRRGTVWADGVLLGCLWLLAEWARGFVF